MPITPLTADSSEIMAPETDLLLGDLDLVCEECPDDGLVAGRGGQAAEVAVVAGGAGGKQRLEGERRQIHGGACNSHTQLAESSPCKSLCALTKNQRESCALMAWDVQ